MEPCSAATFRTPSRFQRKSRCHQLRRYSPSVTARRPRAFGLATSWAILALGYPPLRKALPCLFEGIAPEETADDIVTERGNCSLGCSEKGTSHLWSLHYRVTLFCVSEYSSRRTRTACTMLPSKSSVSGHPRVLSPQSVFTQSFSGAINLFDALQYFFQAGNVGAMDIIDARADCAWVLEVHKSL